MKAKFIVLDLNADLEKLLEKREKILKQWDNNELSIERAGQTLRYADNEIAELVSFKYRRLKNKEEA